MRAMATRDGPRERARLEGLVTLSDAELVALVLGTGRKGEPATVLSAALLAEHGGLEGLASMGPLGLASRAGIGEAKGMRLAAAMEIGRRASARGDEPLPVLVDSSVVARWAYSRIGRLEHEELWMLAVDGHRRLRAARCVARGGLHGLGLHVRDPLRVAIREGASGVVLVHNHPSGDPTPSPEDIEFTRRFMAACEVVATPLIDHVIVAARAHTSLLSLGYLEPLS
jgi:DNA repair protein RadC